MLEGTILNSQYVDVMVNREAIQKLNMFESTTPTIDKATEARVLARGSLGAGDTADYTLRLWLSEDVTADDVESMNKVLTSKIVVTAEPGTYNPVEQDITKLNEALLANEYHSTVDIAKNRIANKPAPNFATTAPTIIWQENHEVGEVSVDAYKPHPSLVGNASLGGQNLNENSPKLLLGKSYTFDPNKGHYTMNERSYVDPTSIVDYGSQPYYFCGGGTNVDTSGVISAGDNSDCKLIYKVNSVTKADVGTSGTNGYRVRYTLIANRLSQSELESDKSDKGLYQTTDDLGTSYYYRGNVNNNFVKLGDTYYRVIRINGDGSVRLIYNGPNTNQTGDSTQIKTTAFNMQGNNPVYVGYMYENTLNSSYADTTKNEVESNIKQELDSWYKINIVDKGYSDLIADEIFCNDRSVTDGDGFRISVTTTYGAYTRLVSNKTPILTCPQDNDKFTVNTDKGNGALTHPVGLITADEIAMAGAVNGYINRLFYLYTGQNYWSLSPSSFWSTGFSVFVWFEINSGEFYNSGALSALGARAVINLRPDVLITGGIGTANDPFVVKTT